MNILTKLCAVLTMCAIIPAPANAQFRLADDPVYKVDVSNIELVLTIPPKEYPEVSHRAAVTYEDAARAWMSRRFVSSGESVNKLRVTVTEGRIVEKILPIKKGIAGWFKKEQSTEYEARLAVNVAIVDPMGKVVASADGKAWHTLTTVEGTPPREREAAWVDMISTTFNNLDKEIGGQLVSNLSNYVQLAPQSVARQ